jgi:hypothetical protein
VERQYSQAVRKAKFAITRKAGGEKEKQKNKYRVQLPTGSVAYWRCTVDKLIVGWKMVKHLDRRSLDGRIGERGDRRCDTEFGGKGSMTAGKGLEMMKGGKDGRIADRALSALNVFR